MMAKRSQSILAKRTEFCLGPGLGYLIFISTLTDHRWQVRRFTIWSLKLINMADWLIWLTLLANIQYTILFALSPALLL